MTDGAWAEKLTALIEEERQALLNGDLDSIEKVIERKQELIVQIANTPPNSPDELEPLRLQLRRNQVLYDHALAGLRNVADRLGTLRRLRKSLDTYDAYGQRQSIEDTTENQLERRA
ncbi:MAG: flagellar protein FlgN [Paracoccaceae bacterium]|nr:flagellar protein FlgN [Paracoccaceae bacterium]